MIAKQPAKKKREARPVAAPLSKPSYWDEVGIGKPNASALKAALADTVLVDAAWLAKLADEKGVLPRCQDLPNDARVTLEEMERWKSSSTVGVLVVSYPWWAPPHSTLAYICLVAPAASAPGSPFTNCAPRLDADHPDKKGLQLRAMSNVLKMFDKEAKKKYGVFCKVGVFIDYVSMPQRSRGSPSDDRTSGQKATFDRSLQVRPPHLPARRRPAHRFAPTPRCLPLTRGCATGTVTRRRTCSSSTPNSPRARIRTCSLTPGGAGA